MKNWTTPSFTRAPENVELRTVIENVVAVLTWVVVS
jgi:hypothetical protein